MDQTYGKGLAPPKTVKKGWCRMMNKILIGGYAQSELCFAVPFVEYSTRVIRSPVVMGLQEDQTG